MNKTIIRLPNRMVILGVLVAAVLSSYVLCCHYAKVRHAAYAVGRRLTADNIPLILSAIAWPAAIVFSVFILRIALRGLIDRIRSASVGNESGPIIKVDMGDGNNPGPPPPAEKPRDVDGISFSARVRSNVTNTYWVGADLMTLFDVILRGGNRDQMLALFRQVNHHLKVLRMKDTPLYVRFRRLNESVEKSLDSDWLPSRRAEVAREVHSITGSFGQLVAETQPDFSGDAKTSADL